MGDEKVKGSKVREYVKGKGYRISGDVMPKLDRIVSDALDRGLERTKAGGRTTLKASDL